MYDVNGGTAKSFTTSNCYAVAPIPGQETFMVKDPWCIHFSPFLKFSSKLEATLSNASALFTDWNVLT